MEVSAHSGARPDHAEWQGKWYSLSGTSEKYPSLREATGYGTVTGLMGANCRHSFYPVIDGISEPLYTEEELANIDQPPFEYNGKTYTEYEATQRQRYMERAIRKTKRELLAAENTNDEEQFTAKSVLLRRQKEEYNKFSKAAGLLTENERTQVADFGRSQASKAVWAAKKANNGTEKGLTSTPKNDKISNNEDFDNPIKSIISKVRSIFDKTHPINTIENTEIEDTLKALGFKSVDKSFFKQVNREMQLSVTDQLYTLERKFNAIRRSNNPYISADKKGTAVACVRHRIDKPECQSLHLSNTLYKNKKRHISDRKIDVNTFFCMPCNIDDETLSRYVVTHEYGHIVENILISEEMKGRSGNYSDFARRYRNEITEIAKLIDRDYDESKYLSKYGSTKDTEFFAECFANSQLGKPNVLGHAIKVWFERRGY